MFNVRNQTTGRSLKHARALLLSVSIVSSFALAQDSNAPKSMLYLDPEPDRSDLTTLPASQRPIDQGDRCIELMKEVEALKGKPQRRSTAMARYDAECRR